jgi:RNA polymerase sigma-70 factor (ECF subfamily)
MNGRGADRHRPFVVGAEVPRWTRVLFRVAGENARVSTATRFEFDDVYSANVDFVWRVLRGMGVSDPLIDDAAQDVFVVVHRRLAEFDGRFAVKTWLFEIAYRIACDYRRKGRRLAGHGPLEEDVRDRAPSPSDSAEGSESLRFLEGLLDRMDDEKRAVLVLSGIEGMTAPEIAAVTATPLNTVYTRLRRARAELSDALAARERPRR